MAHLYVIDTVWGGSYVDKREIFNVDEAEHVSEYVKCENGVQICQTAFFLLHLRAKGSIHEILSDPLIKNLFLLTCIPDAKICKRTYGSKILNN